MPGRATSDRCGPAIGCRSRSPKWVEDPRQSPSARVRAIEVLTELWDGLPPRAAGAAARASVPFVRARIAWSLGRSLPPDAVPLVVELAQDAAPLVRRCALEALADHAAGLELAPWQTAVTANLAHRIRPCDNARHAGQCAAGTRLACALGQAAKSPVAAGSR